MDKEILTSKKVFIRSLGRDENWLKDMICENPSLLGLGDLIVRRREQRQSSGGRIDILLEDIEDKSLYEVEVMLGETNPDHIVRSIEYWDIEKRRFPQRQHFSVLIAESFDRRYFNVIQILSLNVPMIAIQADLLKVEGKYILNFTKILDIYEEPGVEIAETPANEESWKSKALWVLEAARALLDILKSKDDQMTIGFTQSYIALRKGTTNIYTCNVRRSPFTGLWFRETDEEKTDKLLKLLDSSGLPYKYSNKYKDFLVTLKVEDISDNSEIFEEIHNKLLEEIQPPEET